jgi:hypothetical protein
MKNISPVYDCQTDYSALRCELLTYGVLRTDDLKSFL